MKFWESTMRTLFIGGFFLYMMLGFVASAQSVATLQERIETVREISLLNAGRLGVLEEKVNKNSDDIKLLIEANKDLAASMNRFTGIGIAVAAIGAIHAAIQLMNGRRSNKHSDDD